MSVQPFDPAWPAEQGTKRTMRPTFADRNMGRRGLRLLFVCLLLVMAAPLAVVISVPELCQLLVEVFDRGFLLSEQLLDEVLPAGLDGLLLV